MLSWHIGVTLLKSTDRRRKYPNLPTMREIFVYYWRILRNVLAYIWRIQNMDSILALPTHLSHAGVHHGKINKKCPKIREIRFIFPKYCLEYKYWQRTIAKCDVWHTIILFYSIIFPIFCKCCPILRTSTPP